VSIQIAITANTSWYLFNFRYNLIRALIHDGYKVTAVAPRDEYSEKLIQLGCEFKSITIDQRGTNPVADIYSFLSFYKCYRDIRPDAVLNFTPKNNIYSTLAASRLHISVINNIAGLGSVFVNEGFTSRIVRWLYRISQKHASIIFFQNDEDKQLMLDGGYVTAIQARRLPGSGVDLERFKPHPKLQENGKIVFILIARMLYQKGIVEYVNVAKRLIAEYPDTEFRLLGFIDNASSDSIAEHVIQKWHKSGAIKYLGASDEVESEIAEADCVVLPSYYREGVPRSLLEGAAMGKPLITTNNVGCRDTVVDGLNGYLCDPKCEVSLLEKMKKFLDLPKEEKHRMGEDSRKLVEDRFDEKYVIAKYKEEIIALS
jgi:glycosyltransferase involved in cell wall biosynthesis